MDIVLLVQATSVKALFFCQEEMNVSIFVKLRITNNSMQPEKQI